MSISAAMPIPRATQRSALGQISIASAALVSYAHLMLSEPPELDRGEIGALLADRWSITVDEIDYAPVGFGSHHWIVTDGLQRKWFVTADWLVSADDAFPQLDRAFRLAAALSDAGVPFVLAPTPACDGAVLIRLGTDWAVSVRPYIDADPLGAGPLTMPTERLRAVELVADLHVATPFLNVESAPRETFDLPAIPTLMETIGELDHPWELGPYGEPARSLLHGSRQGVLELIDSYRSIARTATADQSDWVITHGEPHGTNILVNRADELFLIDWDTAVLGPRERDLWMILDGDGPELRAYRAKVGSVNVRSELLRLYQTEWALNEIASYTRRFRLPHTGSEDDREAWHDLQSYLPINR